jgi:hypothetical protein
MPKRSTPAIAAAMIMLTLGGCAGGGRLSEEAPPGVRLAGVWRLNPAASDDPRKALEHVKRPPAPMVSAPPTQARHRRPGSAPQGGTGTEAGGNDTAADQEDPRDYHGDAQLRSPYAQLLESDLIRSDVLTIRQTPEALVFDYGTSVRRFKPGMHSVVSVPGGVADQSTGWEGTQYVVQVNSHVSPSMTERYTLSADHRQLILKLNLAGAGVSSVQLKRVYDAVNDVVPRSLPTND